MLLSPKIFVRLLLTQIVLQSAVKKKIVVALMVLRTEELREKKNLQTYCMEVFQNSGGRSSETKLIDISIMLFL